MQAFTDYPFEVLGDTLGELAPIRQCTVLSYDGNKYCTIMIGEYYFGVKRGYLYQSAKRCGEGKMISLKTIQRNIHYGRVKDSEELYSSLYAN